MSPPAEIALITVVLLAKQESMAMRIALDLA